MAKLEEKLLKLWQEMEQEKSWGGCRFIYSHQDVSWYAGCPQPGGKVVWTASAERPQSLPQCKAVSIVREIFNGRPSLKASLTDGDAEVFAALWADLIKYSSRGTDTADVLQRFASRYKTWVKLLMLKKQAKLTKEEQKGLLGELCFLSSELEKGRETVSAVSGWMGPEGADQDFCWAEGWHEIKATGFGSDQISISSLQQLSAPGSGHLCVYFIDAAAPERIDGISLPDMVEKIKAQLESSDDALNLFGDKLISAGYIDLDDYQEQKFFIAGRVSFKVDEAFPRLTPDCVRPGIVDAQYQLSLSALFQWKEGL